MKKFRSLTSFMLSHNSSKSAAFSGAITTKAFLHGNRSAQQSTFGPQPFFGGHITQFKISFGSKFFGHCKSQISESQSMFMSSSSPQLSFFGLHFLSSGLSATKLQRFLSAIELAQLSFAKVSQSSRRNKKKKPLKVLKAYQKLFEPFVSHSKQPQSSGCLRP